MKKDDKENLGNLITVDHMVKCPICGVEGNVNEFRKGDYELIGCEENENFYCGSVGPRALLFCKKCNIAVDLII